MFEHFFPLILGLRFSQCLSSFRPWSRLAPKSNVSSTPFSFNIGRFSVSASAITYLRKERNTLGVEVHASGLTNDGHGDAAANNDAADEEEAFVAIGGGGGTAP